MTKQRTFDSLSWCNSPAYCEDALWRELTAARPKCAYAYGMRYCRFRDDPILSEEQIAAGLSVKQTKGIIELHEPGPYHKCVDCREAGQVDLIKQAAAKWMREHKKHLNLCDTCLYYLPGGCGMGFTRSECVSCHSYLQRIPASGKAADSPMAQVCQGCQKWVKNHCSQGWWPAAEWNHCSDHSTKPQPVAPVPNYAKDKAEIVKALRAMLGGRYSDCHMALAALEGEERK